MATKYLWPMITSLLIALAGAALIIWPFTTHVHATSWTQAMTTDFWSGIGTTLIGLLGLAGWYAGLKRELVEKGFISQRRPVPAAPPQPLAEATTEDLNRLLRPLAETVLRDLTAKLDSKSGRPDGGGTGA